MGYLAAVLAILLLLAIIIVLANRFRILELQKMLDTANINLKNMVQAVEKERVSQKDVLDRRDVLITELKRELARVDKQLAENRDPVALRSRIGKLLSDP
jgi:predicted Holliday junction resolvase-like endonuclease